MGAYDDYWRTATGLAERAGATARAVPTRDLPSYEGYFVRERPGGLELWFTERGEQDLVVSGDAERVVYEVLRGLTWSQAVAHELAHRRRGEDTRRQWMADHIERMAALRPEWGERVRAAYAEVLERAPFDDQLAKRAKRWSELMAGGMARADAVAQAEREFPPLRD